MIIAVCFSAFCWLPAFEKRFAMNLFLTPHSMTLLGVILTAYLFNAWWVRDKIIFAAEQIVSNVKKHLFVWLAVFLAISLLGIYAINQKVLFSFFNSADEHSCYFAAECIRMGKWWVKPHALSEFFNVVHVGNRDGKWFSVYPPGWPLIWAFGLNVGAADWLNPALSVAALLLLFLSARKIYGAAVAAFGIFFIAITPFFTFTSASYFSHSTCLFAISVFIYAFLRWMESKTAKERVMWACLCAFAGGYGLLTRYLTMAAVMAPFILYRLIRIIRKEDKLDSADIAFAISLGFMMMLVLAHNYAVTGKPFKAPNKYDKSWERLGFKGSYSVREGLINVITRLFYLSDWAPPYWVAAFVFLTFKREPLSPFASIFKTLFWWNAFAYFLYFSWGGNQYGPRYYFEVFPFLIFTVLRQARQNWKAEPLSQRRTIALLIAVIAVTPFQFLKQVDYFQLHTSQRKALFQLAESKLDAPSIVFIRGPLGTLLPLSQDDAVRNAPSLNAEILYAHDRGNENSKLIAYYPDRKAYIGWYDRDSRQARLDPLG